MVHLGIDAEKVNPILLSLVIGGYFALELAVIAYIIYLILGGTKMPERRRIRDGEQYRIDEDVELETPDPDPDPPLEEVRGEPWGWTKPGDRPRGWPGPSHLVNDPGPYDGEWEPRR